MKLFNNTWKLAIAGAIVGVLAALLAFFGNPGKHGHLRGMFYP